MVQCHEFYCFTERLQIKLLIGTKSHNLCLGKFYIIRSQEKNSNQNRDSNLGPSAGLEIRRSEVRISVLVRIFLLRSYNIIVCESRCHTRLLYNSSIIDWSLNLSRGNFCVEGRLIHKRDLISIYYEN